MDKTTKRLQARNRKLRELDRLKDEFLSMASHDLLAPLTSVKGNLWMVLRHRLPQRKKRKHLERAFGATERLIAFVEDMLSVSRIEAGRLSFSPKRISLPKLALDIKDELRDRLQEKSIRLSIRADKSYGATADPDRIRQVLRNLVENAIKFSPKGGQIVISFAYQGGMVETAVRDKGTGIQKENQRHIFSKFGRLDPETPGTGLGLYICKRIVEMSEGNIDVESALGFGSRFSFTLPRA